MSDLRMPFGKHRGEKVEDLPSSYIERALVTLEWLPTEIQTEMENQLSLRRGEGVSAEVVRADGATARRGGAAMRASRKKPETAEEWKALLMQFIGSLSICDHMGDVSNDVQLVLEALGESPEWDDWPDLRQWLAQRGVTTLYGSSLADE